MINQELGFPLAPRAAPGEDPKASASAFLPLLHCAVLRPHAVSPFLHRPPPTPLSGFCEQAGWSAIRSSLDHATPPSHWGLVVCVSYSASFPHGENILMFSPTEVCSPLQSIIIKQLLCTNYRARHWEFKDKYDGISELKGSRVWWNRYTPELMISWVEQ